VGESNSRRVVPQKRGVTILVLAYSVAVLVAETILAALSATGITYQFIFVPFVIAFIIGGLGVWYHKTWGRIVAVASAVIFFTVGLPFNIPIFVNPQNPNFFPVISVNGGLIIMAAYSTLYYLRHRG